MIVSNEVVVVVVVAAVFLEDVSKWPILCACRSTLALQIS